MKKDRLYTVNPFNQQVVGNMFALGGNQIGVNTIAPVFTMPEVNSDPLRMGIRGNQFKVDSIAPMFGTPKVSDKPLKAVNIGGDSKGIGEGAGVLVGGLGTALGGVAQNAITGGFNYGTGAGNAIGSIGGQVGSALGTVNPILGAAVSFGTGVIGGLVNRAFGHQENDETKAAVKGMTQGMNDAGNALAGAGSTEEFLNGAAGVGGAVDISKEGFSNGWFNNAGDEAYNKMVGAYQNAVNRYGNRLFASAESVDKSNDENTMRSFFAFGGSLDHVNEGALDYDFMSDYIAAKNKANAAKGKVSDNVFSGGGVPTMFAIGGDIQRNGGDYSTGLTHIDAGGTHETSPYGGVQVGFGENGQPNLVEEGETIFDDYVYSRRIMADEKTKKRFHINKDAKISYAELSKKIEKDHAEQQDAITKRGFKKQMHDLADEQERQKAEEMVAMQEEMNAEAMAPGAGGQNPGGAVETPQQTMGMRQQPMEMPQEAMQEQMAIQQMGNGEEMMAAYGGPIRYDKGGELKKRIYKQLGFHTDSEFDKWAKDNKITVDNWENALENEGLRAALGKDNAIMQHLMGSGYDFGVYQPGTGNKATIQNISRGNWKTTDGKGWRGSDDLAFKQATEGMSDADIDALTTEQLAEKMRNTDAYKKTSKWLENADNALLYMNTLLNDPNTPQVAKDYAAKYVTDGKWKDGFTYDYGTVFGKDGKGVRETNPGTYWHSVMEATRGNTTKNFVQNEDGSIEEIVGDVPTDWKLENTSSWKDAKSDYTHNYYKRAAAPAEAPQGTPDKNDVEPLHRDTWGRMAGLFGPVAGLGMMAAGIGKPDYSRLDAAAEIAQGAPALAEYRPIGNYLRYSPMDIWAEQNRLNANARATDRAIVDSNGTLGTKMAGLLASGYNDQIGSGELFRKAQEYNDSLNKQVQEFNRGTDMFNATAFNQTSATNAGILNSARQQRAATAMAAAQQRMEGDAGWYNSLYGNVRSLFNGLGQWGKENEQFNMLSALAADGAFGNLGSSNTGKRWVRKKEGE